jgi:hypothetical protein
MHRLNSVRILKAETVHRMTTNALPSDIRFAGDFDGFVGPRGGSTFGLGFAVRSDAASSVVPSPAFSTRGRNWRFHSKKRESNQGNRPEKPA